MLGSIRKFSSSIYAKVFLFIVAIPFVFWGMGPVFQSGKQNVIVEIGKEKISIQEFIDFIKYKTDAEENLNNTMIEKLLSTFIGQKLINLEIKAFDIKISDNGLSQIIKNEKIFTKEDKFSRTEYEKFLIKNRIDAVYFEANVLDQAQKEQLFEFIVGGISPPNFLVNFAYNKLNQTRNVQIINLDNIYKKKIKLSKNDIQTYFDKNKDSFSDIFKSIKSLELGPKKLTGRDEYDDLFFEKIDMIDDFIIEGKNFDDISNELSLGSANLISLNKSGKNKNFGNVDFIPNEIIKNIFNLTDSEPTILIESKNKYYLIELAKTEKIQKNIEDEKVKKEILFNLENAVKRKLISEIISKINNKNFNKSDFDKISKEENAQVKNVVIKGQEDTKVLNQGIINQIYRHPQNKVIVVSNIGFSENYLIYIDKVENIKTDKNADDYEKYLNLSKAKIVNGLYTSYDLYLKNKYEININYNALNNIKDNFR